jgi:hypothetical protein
MDKLNLEIINTNKYFIGTIMILLTIGGRFIIGELSEKQKEKINNSFFRKIFIFCSCFMATRDIIKALLLTVFFSLIIHTLLKEDEDDIDNIDEEEMIENHLIYL